jgi:hypothetical protein
LLIGARSVPRTDQRDEREIMSGVFNPNDPSVRIRATDDEAVAKRHGLTEWDDERGQYVAPHEGGHDKPSADAEQATPETVTAPDDLSGTEPVIVHGDVLPAPEGDPGDQGPETPDHADDKPPAGRKRK